MPWAGLSVVKTLATVAPMVVFFAATRPWIPTLMATCATGLFIFCLDEWDPGRERPSVLVRVVLVTAPVAAALCSFFFLDGGR